MAVRTTVRSISWTGLDYGAAKAVLKGPDQTSTASLERMVCRQYTQEIGQTQDPIQDRASPPKAQPSKNVAATGNVDALLQEALQLDFCRLSHSVRNNATVHQGEAHPKAEFVLSRSGAPDQAAMYTWC